MSKKIGLYSEKNVLNDLTGKEWLKSTKSFWFSESSKIDKKALEHPAPFMIADIEKLINLFTKKNMTVLDPFVGSGTTLIACAKNYRNGIGIDLNKEYKKLFEERFYEFLNSSKKIETKIDFITGNSNNVLNKISDLSIDYVVTSPPYHNILRNRGKGTREKKNNGYRSSPYNGVEYYSNEKDDLGNFDDYAKYLIAFKKIMKKTFKKIKNKKYCSIIISDFTINKKERNVQSDIVKIMEKIGFEFVGTIILLQDKKPLYPFGYPYQYKINHHHQNIINFRKNIFIDK